MAEGEGLSRQEIVRRAVFERYERYERTQHTLHVNDSTERMLERWSEVLERVANT